MVAATNVVLHQNLVFTVLDVKPRVWKTVDVSSVLVLKAKGETAVRMSPGIARFMKSPQTKLFHYASSTQQIIPLTALFVFLVQGTALHWPFHSQWKINISLKINRCQTTIPFLKILLTGRSFAWVNNLYI